MRFDNANRRPDTRASGLVVFNSLDVHTIVPKNVNATEAPSLIDFVVMSIGMNRISTQKRSSLFLLRYAPPPLQIHQITVQNSPEYETGDK